MNPAVMFQRIFHSALLYIQIPTEIAGYRTITAMLAINLPVANLMAAHHCAFLCTKTSLKSITTYNTLYCFAAYLTDIQQFE